MHAIQILLILVISLVTVTSQAEELLLLAGGSHESGLKQTTYAWSVEYHQIVDRNTDLSLGWFNEGHFRDHHRDGPVAQIWRRLNLGTNRRLSLALGIGPYAYFDTQLAAEGASYANDHGFGLVLSAGLTWYSEQRWLWHARVNHIATDTHIDTTNLLLGVGYQLDAPPVPGPLRHSKMLRQTTTRNELTVFLGKTILNSFNSEDSTAMAIEYRRGLTPHIDWSLALLHEGGHHIIRRNGITGQLWLVRPFMSDRLVLGAGAGAYLVLNKEHLIDHTDDEDEKISGVVTLTTSYRFDTRWLARLSWNRVVTGYSRDTDVLLLGGGYRF